MQASNEDLEQGQTKVHQARGGAWQKLLVTYYTGLHSQGKTVLLAPLPSWPQRSLPFFQSCSHSPFCFPPSLPVNLEVHICHLLQTPKVKLCAYKPISTCCSEQQHSVDKAKHLVQAPEYSSVQPTCTTPEAIASAIVMNHKFRTEWIDPLKVIYYSYYCWFLAIKIQYPKFTEVLFKKNFILQYFYMPSTLHSSQYKVSKAQDW